MRLLLSACLCCWFFFFITMLLLWSSVRKRYWLFITLLLSPPSEKWPSSLWFYFYTTFSITIYNPLYDMMVCLCLCFVWINRNILILFYCVVALFTLISIWHASYAKSGIAKKKKTSHAAAIVAAHYIISEFELNWILVWFAWLSPNKSIKLLFWYWNRQFFFLVTLTLCFCVDEIMGSWMSSIVLWISRR